MDGRAAIVYTHTLYTERHNKNIMYCVLYACPMYMYITEKDGCINEKLHCMHVQYIYVLHILGLLATEAAVSATYFTEDSTLSSAYLDARV